MKVKVKYRKIDPRIWNDDKFRSFSDRGKLVFLFILTHPHMTSIGAIRSTVPGLAAELGWNAKAFGEAFGEAFDKGMVKVDKVAPLLWCPNFLKYNKPESPNCVVSWQAGLNDLPECPLKYHIVQHVKAFTKGLPEAFMEALPKDFGKTSGIQEQEQELEYEQEQEKEGAAEKPADPTPSISKDPQKEIEKVWIEKGFDTREGRLKFDPQSKIDFTVEKQKMLNWAAANPPKKRWSPFVTNWLNRAMTDFQYLVAPKEREFVYEMPKCSPRFDQ